MAKLRVGDNQHSREPVGIPTPSVERVAEMLGVSRDTVMEAKTVIEGVDASTPSITFGRARRCNIGYTVAFLPRR